MSFLRRRESPALKSNTHTDQINLEAAPATGVLWQLLQAELDAAYEGVFEDIQTIAADRLGDNDLHDLVTCLEDRLADIKYGHAALAAFERDAYESEQISNVVELRLPPTLADKPAA